MTSCISQDNANFKNTPWQEVIGLPLPSEDSTFSAGTPISTERFDDNGEIVSFHSPTPKTPSTMGELVKLFDLWYVIGRVLNYFLIERYMRLNRLCSCGRILSQ